MQYQQGWGPKRQGIAAGSTGAAGQPLTLLWQEELPGTDPADGRPRARWLQVLGWPADRDATQGRQWVQRVVLEGVTQRSLWRLQLRVGSQMVFDLEAADDGRGDSIAAGELIEAMNTMHGHGGLWLDLPGHGAWARSVQVHLWLLAPQPDCVVELRSRTCN